MYIGSLTSYPLRLPYIIPVLKTIVKQTHKLEKILLVLSLEEFPNKEKDIEKINSKLNLFLDKNNIEILWCDKNLRAYKKLLYTIKKYPNEHIFTFDDDIKYPKSVVKKIIQISNKYPNTIVVGHEDAKMFNNTKKDFFRYQLFSFKSNNNPCYNNTITGAFCCYYPPNSLGKEVLNIKKAFKVSKICDDLWFWVHAVLKGTKISFVKYHLGWRILFKEVKISQKNPFTLHKIHGNNNNSGSNLYVMQKYFKLYPQVRKILEEEVGKIWQEPFAWQK